MVLVIFTCNGKVNAQALPYGSHVNANIFKRFLIRTGEKWRTLGSDPTKLIEVTIQFDNARPHRAKCIADFFSLLDKSTHYGKLHILLTLTYVIDGFLVD